MISVFFWACVVLMQLFTVRVALAVEVLSARELGSHCAMLSSEGPDSIDGQYCIRYIQGFIDGAVATDVRVMLNVEDTPDRKESYSERAKRMRAPSLTDQFRASSLAGFCLGDPLPLRNVVDIVAADLAAMAAQPGDSIRAMDAVYASLRQKFPCKS